MKFRVVWGWEFVKLAAYIGHLVYWKGSKKCLLEKHCKAYHYRTIVRQLLLANWNFVSEFRSKWLNSNLYHTNTSPSQCPTYVTPNLHTTSKEWRMETRSVMLWCRMSLNIYTIANLNYDDDDQIWWGRIHHQLWYDELWPKSPFFPPVSLFQALFLKAVT